MTKRTPETLTAICDVIAGGVMSQAEAARRCGVSVASFWAWISQSQRGSPDLVLPEYLGEANMPFHKAVAVARRLALHDVVGRMETRAISGSVEKVFYQGRPTFVEDETLAHLTDEDLVTFGIPDRYLRDQLGHRIQNTIVHEPPVALVLAVASANFPKVYGAKSEVNINQKTSLGVTIVKRDYNAPHKVAAPPEVQIVEHQPEAVSDAVVAEITDEVGDEPEVEPTLMPTPIRPSGDIPLTPLQMDLLQRSKLPPSSERAAPVAKPYIREQDDCGPGVVPPGGFKMA